MGCSKSVNKGISNFTSVKTLGSLILESTSSGGYTIKDPLPREVRVIDCTAGAYDKFTGERIPGARFLELKDKFTDPDGKYPNTFPSEDVVRIRAGEFDIDTKSKIFLYVTNSSTNNATRALFIFKAYGFIDTKILTGGFAQWKAAGYPVETADPPPDYRGMYGGEMQDPKEHLVTYEDVKEIEEDTKNNIIIDARSKDQYEGKSQPSLEGCKPGHIPNAINIPFSTLLEQDGTLKPVEELKEIFDSHKIDDSKQIVCYCNGGTSATLMATSLSEVGYKNVKVFDGSWSEYGSKL